jgi:hypothetical protein
MKGYWDLVSSSFQLNCLFSECLFYATLQLCVHHVCLLSHKSIIFMYLLTLLDYECGVLFFVIENIFIIHCRHHNQD